MSGERAIVVAVEDMATAGIVAAGAAQFAVRLEAFHIVLLHVMDNHFMANGFAGLIGGSPPMVETAEEASSILAFAEATIGAEYRAMNRELPVVEHELGEGKPGSTIVQVAARAQAEAIVVGARRPHAFGRLTHPDAVEYLRHHTDVPVHVIALQASTAESAG